MLIVNLLRYCFLHLHTLLFQFIIHTGRHTFGALLGLSAKITGKAPVMTTKEVAMFSGLKQDFDTSKARLELGFNPKPTRQALEEALLYIWENRERILK